MILLDIYHIYIDIANSLLNYFKTVEFKIRNTTYKTQMIIDGKIYKNLFLDLVLNNVNINNPADTRPKNNNVIIVLSVKTFSNTLVLKKITSTTDIIVKLNTLLLSMH